MMCSQFEFEFPFRIVPINKVFSVRRFLRIPRDRVRASLEDGFADGRLATEIVQGDGVVGG